MAKKKEGFHLLKPETNNIVETLKAEILKQAKGDPEVVYSLGLVQCVDRDAILVLCHGAEEAVGAQSLRTNIESHRLESFVKGLLERLCRFYNARKDYEQRDVLRSTLVCLEQIVSDAFGLEAAFEITTRCGAALSRGFPGLLSKPLQPPTCGQLGFAIKFYQEVLVRELTQTQEATK